MSSVSTSDANNSNPISTSTPGSSILSLTQPQPRRTSGSSYSTINSYDERRPTAATAITFGSEVESRGGDTATTATGPRGSIASFAMASSQFGGFGPSPSLFVVGGRQQQSNKQNAAKDSMLDLLNEESGKCANQSNKNINNNRSGEKVPSPGLYREGTGLSRRSQSDLFDEDDDEATDDSNQNPQQHHHPPASPSPPRSPNADRRHTTDSHPSGDGDGDTTPMNSDHSGTPSSGRSFTAMHANQTVSYNLALNSDDGNASQNSEHRPKQNDNNSNTDDSKIHLSLSRKPSSIPQPQSRPEQPVTAGVTTTEPLASSKLSPPSPPHPRLSLWKRLTTTLASHVNIASKRAQRIYTVLADRKTTEIPPDCLLMRIWYSILVLTCTLFWLFFAGSLTGAVDGAYDLGYKILRCSIALVIFGFDFFLHRKYVRPVTIPYQSLDIVFAVPWEIIIYLATSLNPASDLNFVAYAVYASKLLFRGPQYFFARSSPNAVDVTYVWFYYRIYPLLRLFFYFVLFVHGLVIGEQLITENEDRSNSFTKSLYFVWTIVTNASIDVEPESMGERVYCGLLMTVALALGGYVEGAFSFYIFSFNVASANRHTMIVTLEMLKHYQLPKEMQCEILSFQQHMIEDSSVRSANAKVLENLPDTLLETIQVYVKVDILSKAKFLESAPHECIVYLADAMTQFVAEPEDDIIVAGDVGLSMYFLYHGMADVILPNGLTVASIRRGDFFGELALLSADSLRKATVRALTYCDVLELMRDDFDNIIVDFPSFLDTIMEKRTAAAKPAPAPSAPPSLPATKTMTTMSSQHSALVSRNNPSLFSAAATSHLERGSPHTHNDEDDEHVDDEEFPLMPIWGPQYEGYDDTKRTVGGIISSANANNTKNNNLRDAAFDLIVQRQLASKGGNNTHTSSTQSQARNRSITFSHGTGFATANFNLLSGILPEHNRSQNDVDSEQTKNQQMSKEPSNTTSIWKQLKKQKSERGSRQAPLSTINSRQTKSATSVAMKLPDIYLPSDQEPEPTVSAAFRVAPNDKPKRTSMSAAAPEDLQTAAVAGIHSRRTVGWSLSRANHDDLLLAARQLAQPHHLSSSALTGILSGGGNSFLSRQPQQQQQTPPRRAHSGREFITIAGALMHSEGAATAMSSEVSDSAVSNQSPQTNSILNTQHHQLVMSGTDAEAVASPVLVVTTEQHQLDFVTPPSMEFTRSLPNIDLPVSTLPARQKEENSENSKGVKMLSLFSGDGAGEEDKSISLYESVVEGSPTVVDPSPDKTKTAHEFDNDDDTEENSGNDSKSSGLVDRLDSNVTHTTTDEADDESDDIALSRKLDQVEFLVFLLCESLQDYDLGNGQVLPVEIPPLPRFQGDIIQ